MPLNLTSDLLTLGREDSPFHKTRGDLAEFSPGKCPSGTVEVWMVFVCEFACLLVESVFKSSLSKKKSGHVLYFEREIGSPAPGCVTP